MHMNRYTDRHPQIVGAITLFSFVNQLRIRPRTDHPRHWGGVTITIVGIFLSSSRVDAVFCFGHYFRYFPRIKTVAYLFYSRSDFIGSYFRYSPVTNKEICLVRIVVICVYGAVLFCSIGY